MTIANENNRQEILFSLEEGSKVVVDVAVLKSHEKELNDLFWDYANIVNPLIVEYEVEKNEFPIEILNEIRAIVGHIVRATTTKNETEISENISKAHSHMKRATLDGYKYLCVIYDDRYWEFYNRYDTVDWISSGLQNRIYDINQTRKLAVELLRKAKNSEGIENDSQRSLVTAENEFQSTAMLSEMYKNAYNKYKVLYGMLFSLDHDITTFSNQKRIVMKEKESNLFSFFRKRTKFTRG